MKHHAKPVANQKEDLLMSEMLILPDGRVLVQNLTQPMAEILRTLNPDDKAIAPRTAKLSKKSL